MFDKTAAEREDETIARTASNPRHMELARITVHRRRFRPPGAASPISRYLIALLALVLAGCSAAMKPVAAPADPPAVSFVDPAAMSQGPVFRVGVFPFESPSNAPESGQAAALEVVGALERTRRYPEVVFFAPPAARGGDRLAVARRHAADLVVAGQVAYVFNGSGVSASRVLERIRLVRVSDGRVLFSLSTAAAAFPQVEADLFGNYRRTAPAASTRSLYGRSARRFAEKLAAATAEVPEPGPVGALEAGYRKRIDALADRAAEMKAQAAADAAERRRWRQTVSRLKRQIQQLEEKCAARPAGAAAVARETLIGPDLPVRFDVGSASLTWAAKKSLYRIAEILKKHPEGLIRIEGHSDRRPGGDGGFSGNWRVSTERALAVLRFLRKRGGIDPARMCAAGYGSQRPKASNDSPQHRAINRRVEVVLLAQKKEGAR